MEPEMKTTDKKHRYRVTDVRGPQIVAIAIGAILRDAKAPEGQDAEYPNDYRTWEFHSPRFGSDLQSVTAEYLGEATA
jgi:hypothetical protein